VTVVSAQKTREKGTLSTIARCIFGENHVYWAMPPIFRMAAEIWLQSLAADCDRLSKARKEALPSAMS
jgi:hypothetical protein